jgi:hypothetical protein
VTIFFLTPSEKDMTLRLHAPEARKVLQALVDPALLAGLGFLALALYLTKDSKPLARGDRLRAGWYLWNGVIFHTVMDGMVGMGFFPHLSAFYNHLDNRFREHVTHANGGAHHGELAMIKLIVTIELFVMAPLCVAAFVAISNRAPWRYAVEVCVSTMHVFGTVMFLFPELMNGCLNLVPIGAKKSCVAGFSLYELFFFWFATGMNAVWIVVPLYLGVTAAQVGSGMAGASSRSRPTAATPRSRSPRGKKRA